MTDSISRIFTLFILVYCSSQHIFYSPLHYSLSIIFSSSSLHSGLGSLPNTRNKISKWSIRRFGVDVNEMGPPPRARVAGNRIVLHRSIIY